MLPGTAQMLQDQSRSVYDTVVEQLTSLGLAVGTHDWTPRSTNTSSRTVYAIFKAPRGDHTECIVLGAPISDALGQPSNWMGVALLLSLASVLTKQTYWSKDLVFIFPELGHLGVQAWIDQVMTLRDLDTDLMFHIGAIQAAFLLDFGAKQAE